MTPRLYVNAYACGITGGWCTTREIADIQAGVWLQTLGRRRVGIWRTVSHGPGPGAGGVSDGGEQA